MLSDKNSCTSIFHNIIKLFSEVGKSWTGSHYPSVSFGEVRSHDDSMARDGFKWRHADEVRKKFVRNFF
jgi:hypothetical protein